MEQTIGALEDNPILREAASTLFWQVFFYLEAVETARPISELEELISSADPATREKAMVELERLKAQLQEEWANFDLTLLNRIHNTSLMLSETTRDALAREPNELQANAFVQLHLATILLRAIRKQLWGSPELIEELARIGETVFEVLPWEEHKAILFSSMYFYTRIVKGGSRPDAVLAYEEDTSSKPSADEEHRRESLCAVAAVFYAELFRLRRQQDDNLEALGHFSRAAALWAQSKSGLRELNMAEAVDCCENILSAKSSVQSWSDISEFCNLILDSVSENPYSEDLYSSIEIHDRQGIPWTVSRYWQHAGTVAENEMSPTELAKVLSQERASRHVQTIVRDFVEGLWEYLEPNSQKALVQEEISWYDAPLQGGRPDSLVNELRLVFEYELDSIIFKHVRQSVDKILANPKLRTGLKLSARNARTLGLRDMAILLEESANTESSSVSPIRQFIERLPLSSADKAFICKDLPPYLHELATVRRQPEHRIGLKEVAKKARKLRRRALGLGEPGLIARLISIKKTLRSSHP